MCGQYGSCTTALPERVRYSTSSRAKAVTGFTSPRRNSLLQEIAYQPIGIEGLRVVRLAGFQRHQRDLVHF